MTESSTNDLSNEHIIEWICSLGNHSYIEKMHRQLSAWLNDSNDARYVIYVYRSQSH